MGAGSTAPIAVAEEVTPSAATDTDAIAPQHHACRRWNLCWSRSCIDRRCRLGQLRFRHRRAALRPRRDVRSADRFWLARQRGSATNSHLRRCERFRRERPAGATGEQRPGSSRRTATRSGRARSPSGQPDGEDSPDGSAPEPQDDHGSDHGATPPGQLEQHADHPMGAPPGQQDGHGSDHGASPAGTAGAARRSPVGRATRTAGRTQQATTVRARRVGRTTRATVMRAVHGATRMTRATGWVNQRAPAAPRMSRRPTD